MKIEIILSGIIKFIGDKKRVVFDKPDYYHKQVGEFSEGQKVEITIKNKTKKRTKGQNAYWHAVCFPTIGELIGETSAEAKKICKKKYIAPRIKTDPMTKEEMEVPRGSSELDAYEGWEFTTAMIQLASFLGGEILTPCEAGYTCGRSNCMTCNNKFKDIGEIAYPEEDIDTDKTPF